jgi:magnesium chelatase family protein
VAVRESKDRIKAAVKNSGYTSSRATISPVNLAPRRYQKRRARHSISPIALAILTAQVLIPSEP